MAFDCCKGCVKPKRHPGCHDHCPEYEEEKRIHEKRKAADNKRRSINLGLYEQRTAAVTKALRNKKR